MSDRHEFDAWIDDRFGHKERLFVATPEEVARLMASGKLPSDARFLYRLKAASYDDAMRLHHLLSGTGEFGSDCPVRYFPAHNEVFGEPLALHTKHFLPLVSIHSSLVFDDVDTWLHFVTPIEPLFREGLIGDLTGPYHDSYNLANQVALRIQDGRCTFAGDWKYFAYQSGAIFEAFPNQADAIDAAYRERFASYERTRLECLTANQFPGIKQLGGKPVWGNIGEMALRNTRGTPFRFVGELQGFDYCEGVGDGILMFFDPEESIMLILSDWV